MRSMLGKVGREKVSCDTDVTFILNSVTMAVVFGEVL